MKKIKIGILGCANIAQRSVIPALSRLEQFEVVAISSRNKDKCETFASRFGIEAIPGYENLVSSDKIDAVYMPLPTGLHEEWVHTCIYHRKHILCEKSLAISHDSALRMVDAAKANNVLLMENYMFAYHSQHKAVKELIASGAIGELKVFRSTFGFSDLAKDNFRFKKELGGGALLDVGGYTIRAATMFLGDKLEHIGSVLDMNIGPSPVDINGCCSFKNEKNQMAQLAFGFNMHYQCNYELIGTSGKIVLHKAYTPKPDYIPNIILETDNGTDTIKVNPENQFEKILMAFAERLHANDYEKTYNEVLTQSSLQSTIYRNAMR